MEELFVPGTNIPYRGSGGMFSTFVPLIKASNGLTLSQVCAITGLETFTVQNWVKRGFVARPEGKKYFERQLARILLIASIRDCMKIESIGELMAMVNGSANDESDDIISEDRLYDFFCDAVLKLGPGADEAAVTETVKSVTKNYDFHDKSAISCLRDALTVMVMAHIAGKYKNQAERRFNLMKQQKGGSK